jgi:hypothetical protein
MATFLRNFLAVRFEILTPMLLIGILRRVYWYIVGDVSKDHGVFTFKQYKKRLILLDPQDEGTTFLRNSLPVNTAERPRRLESSSFCYFQLQRWSSRKLGSEAGVVILTTSTCESLCGRWVKEIRN